MTNEHTPLPQPIKARAKVVHVWYFEARDAWAVELAELVGVVQAGQQVSFSNDERRAGPYLVISVEFADHLLQQVSSVALLVQAAHKRRLDDFIGGHIETVEAYA